MVCTVLYLLCWDYHKFKNVSLFYDSGSDIPQKNEWTEKVPLKFFVGVIAVIVLTVLHAQILYAIMPRNTFSDCIAQCDGEDVRTCKEFCECIHKEGRSLKQCLEEFKENLD